MTSMAVQLALNSRCHTVLHVLLCSRQLQAGFSVPAYVWIFIILSGKICSFGAQKLHGKQFVTNSVGKKKLVFYLLEQKTNYIKRMENLGVVKQMNT